MASRAPMDHAWADAARRCRLSPDDVRMARELGLEPSTPLPSWLRCAQGVIFPDSCHRLPGGAEASVPLPGQLGNGRGTIQPGALSGDQAVAKLKDVHHPHVNPPAVPR